MMADMPEPQHARPALHRSRADVWFVLIITGGTSATLQMWHATHATGTAVLIAALVGLVPAATAVGLSHVVASHKSAAALRVVTFAVMLAVMAASASASAAVIRPIDGLAFAWVLSLALDAAALASVWVLLGLSERKAAESAALQLAGQTAAEAQSAAEEARREAAEAAGNVAALEAELVSVKAALEAERARRVPARKSRRSSARKPAPVPQPVPVLAGPGSSAPEDVPDLDAEARILALIAEGHSASQAGILAGKSDSYGRQVARLAKAAKTEPAGADRSDGDVS
jgi:hypothetical protein